MPIDLSSHGIGELLIDLSDTYDTVAEMKSDFNIDASTEVDIASDGDETTTVDLSITNLVDTFDVYEIRAIYQSYASANSEVNMTINNITTADYNTNVAGGLTSWQAVMETPTHQHAITYMDGLLVNPNVSASGFPSLALRTKGGTTEVTGGTLETDATPIDSIQFTEAFGQLATIDVWIGGRNLSKLDASIL